LRLAIGGLVLTFVTAVTAGFFVYHFVFSLTEKMKTAFPTQSLQMESVNINSTCITISVRNFASVNVRITGIHIDGKVHNLTENIVIPPNDVGTIHLHGAFAEGETYTLKIAPSLGSPLVSYVKYD